MTPDPDLDAIRQRIQSAKSYIATFDALGGGLGNELVHDASTLLDQLAEAERQADQCHEHCDTVATENADLEAKLAQVGETLGAVSNVLRATRDFTAHRPGCDKLTAMNCACGFDIHGAVYQHALAQAETALKEEA